MKIVKALIGIYGWSEVKNNTTLDEGISIRRLHLLQKEDKLFKFVNWRTQGRATCPYDWIIEFDYQYDEDDSSEPYPAFLFKNQYLEYALKLFHKHDIGFGALIINPYENPFNVIISSKMPSVVGSKKFDEDIEFDEFWNYYHKSYLKKPASYEYFSTALNFPNSIKSFFFCGSLESLFVPAEKRNQKAIFVLNGLKILGFDESEIKIVEDLFEFRNAYIHADKKGQEKLYGKIRGRYLSKWWESCEDIMRKILFKHVDSPW